DGGASARRAGGSSRGGGARAQPVGQGADLFLDADRGDVVAQVVVHLDAATAVGLVYGAAHGVGELVGVHDDRALGMTRGAANGLNERAFGAQIALFIGVE